MVPKAEALMRMCVLKVGQKQNWTWSDWTTWKLLWRFFPWYSRNMRYRGFFCVADDCMHWHWENGQKVRGFCSHADSRTSHVIWQTEQASHQTAEPPPMTGPTGS